ncbi:MAG: hypothetical protein ABI910_02235 [Gemmatimonadota bacterium]
MPSVGCRLVAATRPVAYCVINLADWHPTDANGKPRWRLQVDSLGIASREFLDTSGHVTARLPSRR